MIRHIKGTVTYTASDHLIVDVSGIGYKVFVGNGPKYKLDSQIKLNTHHAIRENASDLYGFETLDELDFFELLLSLPKIGPKSAAQIMSNASLELLKESIFNNDHSHLSKMSGIGKKTAEKIVQGLKDKLPETDINGINQNDSSQSKSFHTDAIDALVALGYPQADARKIVQKLPENISNTNEAVTLALKELSQSS